VGTPSRRIRSALLAAALGTVTVLAAAPGPASAAAAPPDLFTCWANPLSLLTIGMTGGVNHTACVDDQVAGATGTHTAGRLQVAAVDAKGSTARTGGTVEAAGAGHAARTTRGAVADASAASARIVLGANVVDLGAITSHATITCTYDAHGARSAFTGSSTVASVTVNGQPVTVHPGLNVIKVGAGTLRLNHAEVGASGLIQHAVMFDTVKAHLVLGEAAVAIADTAHNPCRTR
jgi:hypothetical protein